MPDGGDHRHRQQRDRAAQALVAEAQQVGERAATACDDRHIHFADRGEVGERAGDQRCGVAILHGREPPDDPPGPAAAREARENVLAGLAVLRGHDPDRARQQRARQELLRRKQSLGVQPPAQALDPSQQIALAGDAQVGDREGEARRGGGAARVEVTASRDHHLHALHGGCAGSGEDRLPVVQPHRARDRARGVAQLEVHACARGTQVDELSDELHAHERAQLSAQRRCVLADSIGSRQIAAAGCPSARGPGHGWTWFSA